MQLTIDGVIFFYIFVCLALLAFNILYILFSKSRERTQIRRERKWEQLLSLELSQSQQTLRENSSHRARMLSKLGKIEELIAYASTVDRFFQKKPAQVHAYFSRYHETFQEVALFYAKRSSMERAFFAYVLASYHPPTLREHDMLAEILLTFLDNSTIYCRENVLHALFASGNMRAVENVLQILNDQDWYHHARLLSDGMTTFAGDREALFHRLWRHRKEWAEFLVVALVQFATNLPDDFREELFPCLEDHALPLEVRFALVRYYQRHPYSPCRPVLLQYLTQMNEQEDGLAIAAASALASYPGQDTAQALKAALHSHDW